MEPTIIGRYRQTMAEDVLMLPGLRLLGHNMASRATVPLELHTHPGALECVVMLKGNETYYAGGGLYAVSGGEAFASFVDEPHSNGSAPQGVSEYIWFQIDPRPRELFGLSPDRADALRSKLLALDRHILKADRECLNLLRKSLAGFLRFEAASRLYASGLFVSFLTRFLFLQRQDAAGDARIGRAVRHIGENILAPIGLSELAGLCGMSLSGFKHKFRECTGETPREYVNHLKIERAKAMLKSGRTVTETAMDLGFSSSDYFAVVFRKFTATTPSKYRAGYS